MSMSARYTPGGPPQEKMDILIEHVALLTQKVELMSQQRGMQVIQHEEVYGDMNYVHSRDQGWSYSDYYHSQGGGNYNQYDNKTSSEDILNALITQSHKNMEHSHQRLVKIEDDVQSFIVLIKNLNTWISQISQVVGVQHQPDQFPGQTAVNPKECKAIYLRSGQNYEDTYIPQEKGKKTAEEKPEEEERVDELEKEEPERAPPPPKPLEVKIPFPQAIQKKKKLDEKFVKFLDIFKKVHLNMPLVEVLQEMPGYLKFLKEVVSKKKKLVDYETVSFTENCSAIIQSKMPAKMKDPGSFNISCVIGNDRQTKALCDLGASINLMPLSFFRKLKFGVLKPTTITLQMADRSVKYPNGILENVLVRVNDFIFPVDFVVLDMKEDSNVPLILGRPFLATGKALIDVTKGELTLRHGNKTAILSMLDKMKRRENEEAKRIEAEQLEVDEEASTNSSKGVKNLKKEKKKLPILAFGTPKGEGHGEKNQCTWWKKRLNKLYWEAKARAGSRGTIRVRMDF